MELFADLSHNQALALTALLKTITTEDCKKLSYDPQTIQEAMEATQEMIRAFEQLGFRTM